MPELGRFGHDQHTQDAGYRGHGDQPTKKYTLAAHPVRDDADPGAEQHQRCPAKKQEHGHHDRRIRPIEHVDPDRQGFEPTQGAGHRTRKPEPPERGFAEQDGRDRTRARPVTTVRRDLAPHVVLRLVLRRLLCDDHFA